MRKKKYSKTEQQINDVLVHHQRELSEIHFPDSKQVDSQIDASVELLKKLGYTPEKTAMATSVPKTNHPVMVPSWEQLCEEAENHVGTGHDLDELFTPEELKENELAVHALNEEYNAMHRLDKYDIGIAAVAGMLGALVDILLVGIPEKTYDGLKAGPLSNYIRDYFDAKFPEEEMKKLANSKVSKVPFDAQDNRHTTVYVEGLSAYYHRMLQLGHDPLLGFVFGIADILNGTMTTIDKKGNIVCQVMENYADRTETDVFSALCKQIIHLKTDVITSMGLPVPLMSIFNLFQFGKIGEEEQTIAEIVQGMYYEGYDFIHFCSMSVPVMVTEVVIRLGYALKRLKEGNSLKNSIPVSLNRNKHPKLESMLFIGHSAAVAINAGKIAFKKNPMAINYAQWLTFARYAYSQLKWGFYEKPELRDMYVRGKINEQLNEVFFRIDENFKEFSSERYPVII